MQEVIDQARPAHFDDWSGFSRAASALTRDSSHRLHRRTDRRRAAPADDAIRKPSAVSAEAYAAPPDRSLRSRPSAGAAVAAQPQPLTVRITSPVDNEFLSGQVKMVAVVEPAAAARADQGSRFLR